MAPCKFYQQGRCTYGASCRNSHDDVGPSHGTTPPPLLIDKRNKKLSLVESKGTCWFFSQGKCTYGTTCRLSHELAQEAPLKSPLVPPSRSPISHVSDEHLSSPTSVNKLLLAPGLKAEAPVFVPLSPLVVLKNSGTAVDSVRANCTFFARGFCRNGDVCSFVHGEKQASQPSFNNDQENEEHVSGDFSLNNYADLYQDLSISLGNISIANLTDKEIHRATVRFDIGGQVSNVKLQSDFSTIQISGLAACTSNSSIVKILANLGFQISEAEVLLKEIFGVGSIAEVKVADPSFAKNVVRNFDSWIIHNRSKAKYTIKAMIGGGKSGISGNRLQLSTITCTWYQPSCVAWLTYETKYEAEEAQEILKYQNIRDRTPGCLIEKSGNWRSLTWVLRLGNLHIGTKRRDIVHHLPPQLVPSKMAFGDPSHNKSDDEAADCVKQLLLNEGELESFQYRAIPDKSKLQATATFLDREQAARAVRNLSSKPVRILGNSKLFLANVVSVKYNILTFIKEALEKDINVLRAGIWQTSHISMKIYPQTDPSKSFTAVRLFGEKLDDVAKAKLAFEKLLTGNVAMTGDNKLWDDFFNNQASLPYLNELSTLHQVYIFRDSREKQLLMYGGTTTKQTEVQEALNTKLATFRKQVHTIILTPELLSNAMQGGMRNLKARFGEAVTLNIAKFPKTISVTGSALDFHIAQGLLEDVPNSHKLPQLEEEDCAICWTEVTEAIQASCGHMYCKDCFTNQVCAADEGDIPLHCAGENCEHTFNLDELKSLLSSLAFDDFLNLSFDIYIRTHPTDFHHCPTPDCPEIYRPNSGETFLCSSCLTSVCTTCNVISHDGMSCEDYKDISSEGMKAFQRWKEKEDARDCPGCKVTIQKSEGCNHMECRICHTHICWFCMETFKTSPECYDHMEKRHDSFA